MSSRVLLIVDSLFPLGPAHQLGMLARVLVDEGYEVHVAVLRDAPSSPYPVPVNVQVHHLQIQKRDLLAWRRLRKLAKSIQPAICHDWSAEWIAGAAIGDRFPHVSSHCYASSVNFDWASWLRRKWNRTSSAAHYVANHEIVADYLKQRGVTEGRVSVIAPAIDGAIIPAHNARQAVLSKYQLKSDSVLVGTVAPLVPASRIKDLIWAVDLISCIRDDVQLLVLGDGAQLDRLRRFSRCTAAEDHIHFVGMVDYPFELLTALDVYWHSHLLWPLPTEILNSMNLGIPVVSVMGEETSPMIIHQTTGFGVNIGGRDEFARWTKYLIERKESARQLAEQGQQHVRKQFPVAAFSHSYLELYDSIGR